MKRNYADEDLEISKEDFEKPENLQSILIVPARRWMINEDIRGRWSS